MDVSDHDLALALWSLGKLSISLGLAKASPALDTRDGDGASMAAMVLAAEQEDGPAAAAAPWAGAGGLAAGGGRSDAAAAAAEEFARAVRRLAELALGRLGHMEHRSFVVCLHGLSMLHGLWSSQAMPSAAPPVLPEEVLPTDGGCEAAVAEAANSAGAELAAVEGGGEQVAWTAAGVAAACAPHVGARLGRLGVADLVMSLSSLTRLGCRLEQRWMTLAVERVSWPFAGGGAP